MVRKLLSIIVLLPTFNVGLLAPVDENPIIECLPRDYDQGSIVCVCNEQHCDTVPQVQKPTVPSLMYTKYTSNKEGLRFKKDTGFFKFFTSPNSITDNLIDVDAGKEYQEIIGWGGAFSDATGINIASMSKKLQEHFLRSYFGEDGIEYNLCRVPLAATDFSTRPYTYLDNEDLTLASFSLAEEDLKYKIPFIQQAMNMSRSNLKLFGSPWTAPLWMKTIPLYAGTGSIKKEFYLQWAAYFIKFLDKYRENGIEFWGVTTGNEPSLGKLPIQATPTVNWEPEEMQIFIRDNLGPLLTFFGYSDLKIIALDDQRGYLPTMETLLNDSKTYSYVDGFGVHWYQDWYKSAQLLNQTHDTFPDKFILATEACEGSFIWDTIKRDHVLLGSWDRAESYANDIIEDINHWVTGWVSWNMALNTEGGPTYTYNFVDAPIIVNATAGEFYKQPMYYAHGHFSKFAPEGSKRIYVSGLDSNSSITISGFKRPDNGTVLVILNRLETDFPINIAVDGLRQINDNLSGRSITTYVYWS